MTWTRRDFVRTSLLGIAAGAFPWTAARALAARGEFVALRRDVGIFTARGGTIGWLVNPSGAVVVDSQFPDTAREFVARMRQGGPQGIDALVNTHHHGDHTAGNAVFREAARRIVAHTRVPELQRQAAANAPAPASGQPAPAPTVADTTFAEEWTAEVGGERVRARHRGPAHTAGDSTVLFERAGVVHMGDLVFNRAYPFIDRAGGASVRGWVEVLERVAAEYPADTLYVFGHAAPGFAVTGHRTDVRVQRDFLAAVLETAQRAIAAGKSREEATALDRLPGFPDHVAISPRLSLAANLGAAYDELSEGR